MHCRSFLGICAEGRKQKSWDMEYELLHNMDAVWRWLFICTDLGGLMNNNTHCHCREGNVCICPKVWYNERGFFLGPLPLFAAPEQELMFCWFQRGSLYTSFLSIIHCWGLCTITSYLNILKTFPGRVVCSKPLPALWCIAGSAALWIFLDSAPRWALPPNSHGPRGSGAICGTSRCPTAGFSCIIQLQRQWKARVERWTAPPLTPKLLRRAGKPQRAFSCSGSSSSSSATD